MRVSARFCGLGPLLSAVLVLWAEALVSQETVDLASVHVRDANNRGIISTVFRKRHTGEEIRLRERTNRDGVLELQPPIACERDEKIVVRPESYLRYRPIVAKDVEPNVEFVAQLRSGQGTAGDEAPWLSAGAGKRALFFTQAAGEARLEGSEDALLAEQWAYVAAAERLNVEVVMDFDEAQDKLVASEELHDAIENFQSRNRLFVTRDLDGPTAVALAEAPFWAVIYRVDPESVVSQVPPQPSLSSDFVEQVSELGDPRLRVLSTNAARAKAARQWGMAGLLFNDTTTRLRTIDSYAARHLANVTEVETFRAMGNALGVDSPVRYDPVQGKFVMSPSLSYELERFQVDIGRAGTGIADYVTLRGLAGGVDVGPYLTRIRAVDSQ